MAHTPAAVFLSTETRSGGTGQQEQIESELLPRLPDRRIKASTMEGLVDGLRCKTSSQVTHDTYIEEEDSTGVDTAAKASRERRERGVGQPQAGAV